MFRCVQAMTLTKMCSLVQIEHGMFELGVKLTYPVVHRWRYDSI